MSRLELGVAGTIRTKHFIGESDIDYLINGWLEDNPDVELIDIKFSTSANGEAWSSDAIIIYRKEG